ncbi:MAG: inositol monophosphatase [Alistipes sp.]|nr:inositol monophosphatase [Candidatus Minthomonas equi]
MMKMKSFSEQIETVVREASRLMLQPFEVTQKDGYANIVTSSDVAVQNFLCDRLKELIPGSGFLCEEENLQQSGFEYTWIIDPIDGTSNYARGLDHCAISVGLKHFDTIISGVVFLPRTDELFRADKGEGAYRNGIPIHVSERSFEDAVICTAFAVYHKEYTDICAHILRDVFLKCNDFRRFGSAATELCYAAMGRCELYFEYLLCPWDFAAASVIVTEAGGYLSAPDSSPLSFDSPCGVIAANSRENLKIFQDIIKKHI